MGEVKTVKLTAQQQQVVASRNGNLLVSAAAGAGKTKVLVDRIMSRICDDKCSIADFIIITYTKAAAAELRARITNELSKRLAENPNNEYLKNQTQLVSAANISTVHTFCSKLLRSKASLIKLPTDFRVADQQESLILKSVAMENTLDKIYSEIEKRPNVKAFIETYSIGRNYKAIPAFLHRVYDIMQSHPWPEEWARESILQIEAAREVTDAADTPWGKYIMQGAKTYVLTQLPLIQEARALCDMDEVLSKSFAEALAADEAKMFSILSAETWDQMLLANQTAWAKAKAIRKADPSSVILKEQISDLRDRYKKGISAKLKDCISCTSKELLEDLQRTALPIKGMFELIEEFEKHYRDKKSAFNVLDFQDLEHETIRLLLDKETMEKTEVAKELSQKYKEILIDEYQDTNDVQETIFSAISNGQNRCMVGDVKQSIYAFRLADPSIFLKHYHKMTDYDKANDGEPRRILLTQNFRSKSEILSATNDVMSLCMSELVGGLNYDEKESLQPGREDFVDTGMPAVELTLIDKGEGSAAGDDDDEEDIAKADIEAKYVADRIRTMLNEEEIMDEGTGTLRPIRASDIAILLRSAKSAASHYVKALGKHQIACSTERNGNILDTQEIATLYSYLQLIDNHTQDVPLVAVLASPLVGMTADDITQVRMAKEDATTLMEAFEEYEKTCSNPLVKKFYQDLLYFIDKAPYMKLSTLFSEIVETTDADNVFGAMSNGTLRMENISKFREMISTYEAGGARSLLSFICYIESLRESGIELPQASQEVAENAVTIMSVHSSKGLEYPVVFLADLSRRFNRNDLKESALLHKELGIGLQVTDIEHRNSYPSIARNAISMAKDVEMKSEELRILYVAMTRAKQKLVMTYCDKLKPVLSRLAGSVEIPLPPSVAQSANNPGEWVILTALTKEEGLKLWPLAGKVPTAALSKTTPWAIGCINAADTNAETLSMETLESKDEDPEREEEPFDAPTKEYLETLLNHKYPYEEAVKLSTKVAASSLDSTTKVTIRRTNFKKKKGDFSAAERGTATHTFMRYADYSKCCMDGIDGIREELARMVRCGLISEADSKAVLTDALYTLFASDTGRELAKWPTRQTMREYSFETLLPVKEIYPDYDDETDEEKITVRGIIDFYVETEEGIVLYDFKTDYLPSLEAEKVRAAEYQEQLEVYSNALEKICGLNVIERAIIYLRSGRKHII